MKDKKINILLIIVCIIAIGTVVVMKFVGKEDKTVTDKDITTTETGDAMYDKDVDMDQFLDGNTLKNASGIENEDAYDTVESIVKVEDDPVNPIFADIPEIKNSLPSMIEAQIRKQEIDLGLNKKVTVYPEPLTFKENEEMISFEMFFNELIPMIHIEYQKETGEMTVLIYERTKENLKKYGWDKVLEEKYNISVN